MAADNMNDDQKGITSFFEEGTVNVDNDFTPSIPDNSQFYCDAMNDGNINMVLNNVKPELIVLLGFSDYGKSTFVGSLYHYLLKTGSIDGYELYDSDTFSGFERRFYLRNIKNDPTAKSKILRTDDNDEYMLTLTFYNRSLGEKKQLIISDRPGETYKKYVDTKDVIKNDESLPRAQRVMILIDTTQVENWDILRGKFKQLFNGLKEFDKMPNEAIYTLLFNKIDVINSNAALNASFVSSKQEIIDFFSSELGIDENNLDCRELDSKHTRNNEVFEKLVKDLIKKDETSKNEEAKLKKSLDWVTEKIV